MKSMKFVGTKKHTVDDLREISPGVFVLSFSRLNQFTPGQVVAISLDEDDPAPRIYSICSGDTDPVMSILFDVVPGGKLTTRLATLKKGDNIFCSAPYGSFYSDGRPAYWIASGTGIAPFISMLKSGQDNNNILIHGGRTPQSFYFREELVEKMGDRYIRCISSGKEEGHYPGRLTAYLNELKSFQPGYSYYLCGGAEMVVEARDILIAKGIPFNQIKSEIYF